MQAINRVRQTVWKEQEDSFLDCATIEADGTMVETAGERKEGIGISYKGQWGYHPLVVALAETQELLYIHNRPGNRASEEDSAFFYDLAIEQCKKAGFRKIVLRGDTAFSSTEHLDRWDESGVKFVLGYSAHQNLCQMPIPYQKPHGNGSIDPQRVQQIRDACETSESEGAHRGRQWLQEQTADR